jgi:predicted SprT family Zn-dependent metalloprotease
MKLNKLLIAILIFILLVNSVYAPNGDSSGSDYDYGSDDSYSDPDFYSNSDPSQWDYSKVEYSQVKDHSKIDSAKYFQDMGCSSCSLDRGGQNVVFSKNGITHPNGNSVSVPGTYPSGSLFVATENRIEVVVPEDTDTISVPNTDTVTVNTQGRDVTLADGTRVNGKLSYDKGQAYVMPSESQTGKKTIIDGLIINEKYSRVNLFFDGKEHPESEFQYISMNKKTKEIILSSTHTKSDTPYGPSVTFTRDNPFIQIEQNDFFSVDYLKGGQIYIQNRDEQNLIPKIIVKEYFTLEDDYPVTAILINDHFNSKFEKGKFSDMQFLPDEAKGKTSTPLSLLYIDRDGNSYLKKESEQKVIFSNFNEMAIIPQDKLEGWTVTTEDYDYAPSKVSEELYFNNQQISIEQLKAKYPSLKIEGAADSVSLKRLSDTLDHLPEELTKTIKTIHLKTDEEFAQDGEPTTTSAYVDKNGDMHLRISSLKEHTIYHELTHVYFHNYEAGAGVTELKQEYFDIWKKIDEVEAENPNDPKLHGLYQQVGQLYDEFDKKRKEHPLKKEWLEVVGGEEAYKDVVEKSEGNTAWKDVADKKSEESKTARNGFVRSYSATNINEDIATFVEKVYTNPDFYKPLINPASAKHDIRYKQKLDILYKYGFIKPEAYKGIIG